MTAPWRQALTLAAVSGALLGVALAVMVSVPLALAVGVDW